MGKLVNQLLQEKYLIIYYAFRKNGQTIIEKNKTPISFFTHPSLRMEYLIKEDVDIDDFSFIRTYVADCWRHEIVVNWHKSRLFIKREKNKRQLR